MLDVHPFLANKGYGTAAEPCVRCGQYGSSPIHSKKPTTVYVVTYPSGSFCGVWDDRVAALRYAAKIGGSCEGVPLWTTDMEVADE